MKQTLTLLAIMLASLWGAATQLIYVLPIDDEIGSTTWLHTRRAIEEADRMKADILLVHLNTYGGAVVHADSIRTALLHCKMPVVAFVDNNAASAGALIALACDTVYMRPDGSMGAATVVNGNDGQAMPDKYQSYMRAMMRATAERHGKYRASDSTWRWRRDPLIAEAMVDHRVVVPGLIDSSRVLTFTPDEAMKWGYADGKAESIDDVVRKLGIDDYSTATFHPTWIDSLMGFFTNPAVQAFLIMIIIGGIYFELQTPGMGFPSVAAITAAALYFLPLYLTGIVSSWVVLMFLGSLILLLLELFVIPGFGIAGFSGIGLMVAAIFIGLLENFSFHPGHIDMGSLWRALATLISGIALGAAAIAYLSSKFAPKWLAIPSELTLSQKVEDGYIGVDTSVSAYIGHRAKAITDLHPSGKIEIDGEMLDAVSLMGYIEAGTTVKVVRHENAQLYVTPIG